MVLIKEGRLLSYPEIRENLGVLRKKSVDQFIHVYNRHKGIENDSFKWGDEIEFSLVKFDHANKRVQLLLKADQFFESVDAAEKTKKQASDINNNIPNTKADSSALIDLLLNKEVGFNPEFTQYIVEVWLDFSI